MSYKSYQPLRFFSDWKVEWNSFFEVDPSADTMEFFAENLLYITSRHRNRSIELQWKPEDDPKGEYVLQVINLEEEFQKASNRFIMSGDWENPYLIFRSKNRVEIVDKLEELMFFLEVNIDNRILESRGVVNEKLEAVRGEFLEKGYSNEIAEKLINSNNSVLQSLLLDCKEVCKENVLFLAENGINKGVKNKAKQLLKSNKFR